MMRYPVTNSSGKLSPSVQGELGSAEGVEEHQAGAGAIPWGREGSLRELGRWRRRRITNTFENQFSGKVVFHTPGSLAKEACVS